MKTIISLLTLLITTANQSQNFTGKATYKTSQKSDFSVNNDKGNVDEKLQEQIRQRIQKMNQKTFVLNFDKTSSTYKELDKLDNPKKNVAGVQVISFNLGGTGNGSVLYKNLQEKRYAHKTEIQGKVFLVKDKLKTHNWQLTSETKNIGTYTCYKATYTYEDNESNISYINGDTKEENKKVQKTVTAWYTPQIPISNGPDRYHGLPGLILEINNGKKVMVCTEIIMNPKKEIKITEPKKGKEVDEKTFAAIQLKKRKELLENMKNGIELGNGVKIKTKS